MAFEMAFPVIGVSVLLPQD